MSDCKTEYIDHVEYSVNYENPDPETVKRYVHDHDLEEMEPVLKRLCKPFEPTRGMPTPHLQDAIAKPSPPIGHLSKLNKHPRDDNVVSIDLPYEYYCSTALKNITEDCHRYFINGSTQDVISVTGFVSAFWNDFDSKSCAKEILESKTFASRNHQPAYDYNNCKTVEDIEARWNEWRELGTQLHSNLELGINLLRPKVCAQNRAPYLQFQEFLKSNHPHWEHYRTEWCVYDEDLKLGGKIDYVGQDSNGELILIDFKRVNTLNTFSTSQEYGLGPFENFPDTKLNRYSMQLYCYKYILEHKYGFKVSKCMLLQMHPKLKTFQLFVCVPMHVEVAQALHLRKQHVAKLAEDQNSEKLIS